MSELSKLLVSKVRKVSADVTFDKDLKVFFNLNYLPKTELSALLARFAKTVTNKATRQKEQEVDTDKLSEEILRSYVNGWKGVTYEWLSNQIPMELEGIDPKSEIPFSYENLKLISENMYDFDGWVLESIKDASNFRAIKKEDEIKN